MSTVMPGLIVNKHPQSTTTTTLLNTAAGDNGLQTNPVGLAETNQFRKEVSHLKVPFDDRYDSGIDSFKECDLQVLREEAEECENNEQYASYNSTVTDRFRNLNINEQSEISEEVCDDALSNECICDDVESCQCLTEDAFYQDDEGDTPLHSSIIYNSPKYAERFISCSPCLEYLNIQNKLRQTPMHLSVIMSQPRVTRQLVVAGANLEMQDHNGQTSLHLACKNNNMECVMELTRPVTEADRYNWPGRFHCPSIPQNLELQNFEGYTCLHLAAFDGNFDLLKYLVSLGANVNARDGKSGRTALHHAIEQGKSDLVRYLVYTLNADVDVLTFDHCTPLHLAVSRKFGEAITVLMDANADRSITNSEGLKADQLHSYTSLFRN